MTIREPGGPEVLVWSQVPDPEPGPGEVLLDVAAAGVNRADLLQRMGRYPPPPGAPLFPGLECSGRIAALGPGVSGWSVGDEACALLAGGGYAERVAVPAGHLLPLPTGVDVLTAAALPEVACTVYSNVVRIGGLRAGQTLLVHGGGSGIGTFAVQLGRALGARVFTTARAAKHEALRGLGAELTIDYTTADFVAAVRAGTDGRGVDVILDIQGAAYLARNIDALAPNGRLLVIGLQGGRRAELNLGLLSRKRCMIAATELRSRPADEKAAIVAGVREDVWPLIGSGRIRPVVDRTLPMERAAEAHRVVEASDHIGKVLLVTRHRGAAPAGQAPAAP